MGTEVGQAPAWRRAARLFTAPARPEDSAPLRWDLGFYLACLAFALPTALASEFYGYRIWGDFATVAYAFGAAHSGYLLLSARSGRTPRGAFDSRWCGIAAVALLAMIIPLTLLVIRRLTGVDWLITPFSWAAQPEVWVIERSADLLLHHGTPYVDVTALGRAPVVNDYTPYGPVMAVFGLPRALLGGTPLTDALTDARWMFALAACACVLGTLKLLKWPRVPVGAAQLALACPLTALTWAVAGPDLAIVGLLVLSCALAATGRVAWSGLVLALVLSAKLIVAPAAAVLAVLVLVRRGSLRFGSVQFKSGLDWAALARFAAALVATTAALHLPVYLVDPAAFTEHVFRFPLGMGVVRSPAASPLPGHLIAETGAFGRVAAFALVGAAAVAMLVWLVRRPPANGCGALLRIAVGLGALILLTPATRYGYLVYPLILLGAHLAFRVAEAPTAPPAQQSATTSS